MENDNKRIEYEYYILQVMDMVSQLYTYPIKQRYAEAVAELKTKKECKGNSKLKAKDVRPNVSKAIDRLCAEENPKILCYKGKYYVPNNSRYLFEKLSEEFFSYLRGKIIVENKQVLLISYNTCAIFAKLNPDYEKNNSDNNYTIQECISDCLGDYCYAVLGEDSFCQVMVKCTTDLGVVPNKNSKDFAVIRALEEAITRVYEEVHLTLKPRKK